MKNIEFIEKGGSYVADFVSEGKCVVQIDNGTVDRLALYRHMPDMEPSYYDRLDFDCRKRVFDLDVPAGMMVRIISRTAVKAAKMALVQPYGGSGGMQETDLSKYATKEDLSGYSKDVMDGVGEGDKAWCHNHRNGGSLKYVTKEGKTAIVSVDGQAGLLAQMACKDADSEDAARTGIIAKKEGVFYVKDKAGVETSEDEEIASKKDLKDVPAKAVTSDKGTSYLNNESDGAIMKFIAPDGSEAKVTLYDASDANKTFIQVVACNKEKTRYATIVAVLKDDKYSFHYLKASGETVSDGNELVVKADLNELATKIAELEAKVKSYHPE